MKTLKDLKKEYEIYQLKSNFVVNTEEFAAFIEIKKDDIDEDLESEQTEIRAVSTQIIRLQLLNRLLGFLTDEIEYHEEDKNILQKEVEIGMKWQEYLRILQESVDQEQLQEWVRLLDFTSDYYRSNYDYLESRRNDLELATKGIESFNPKFSDTREAFDQFFQESINILSPKKAVQKEKEM